MYCAFCVLALMLAACGDDDPDAMPDANAPLSDAGPMQDAAPMGMDAGLPPGPDAAPADDANVAADAAEAMDARAPDAGDAALDADTSDATLDAGQPLDFPETLAESGLYVAGSTSELAPGVVEYAPRYTLWADGADKQRWLWLPPGEQIDTSNMDYWSFPVGTKAWKLFSRDGKKLETRLLWKTPQGWYRMAFAWNDAETEATAVPDGASDVRDTSHDIPKRTTCGTCHDGVPDVLLGVSAIQLSHSGSGLTLASLIADDRLSDPPSADYALPDDAAWNALGYMHANCGHCHNPESTRFDTVDLDLWLRVDELADPTATASYRSTVNQALTDTESDGGLVARIAPRDADHSGVVVRMETRGDPKAMPPVASEQVDEDGVNALRTWIEQL